jgi:hypothetical protein
VATNQIWPAPLSRDAAEVVADVTELLDLLRDRCRTNGLQGSNSAGVVLEQATAAAHDPEISGGGVAFLGDGVDAEQLRRPSH